MLLKKAVAITLIIVGVFSSIVIVWGLVFTKPLPRERMAAGSAANQTGGAAVGTGSDTVSGANGQAGSSSAGTGGQGSTSGPTGVPGSGSSASGSAGSTGAVGGTAAGVAPVLSLSASPGTITSGGSSTVGWSINNGATSPVTCTASGSWTGTKATSGSLSVSPTSTSTYTLLCKNSAGSSTKSVTVTVNSAAPTYCGGLSNCYSLSQIQSHNSSANCWGYTSKKTSGGFSAVVSLTTLVGLNHGQKGISSNLFFSKCGGDITACLTSSGNNPCGNSQRNHSSGDINTYSQSIVGYYDPAKP